MNLCALPGCGASAGMTITSKNSRPPVFGISASMLLAGLAVDGALARDVDVARPAQRHADRAVGHVVDVARRAEQRDVRAHRLQQLRPRRRSRPGSC